MTLSQFPAPADLAAVLRISDVFAILDDDQRRAVADRMTFLEMQDGHVLIQQDGTSEQLYVVIEGRLALSAIDRHGAAHALGEVGPGSLVGEMNVFSRWPAATTIEARGAVRLAALSKTAFNDFAEASPSGALALMDGIRPRLQRQRLWAALHLSEMFGQIERPALVDLERAFELVALYGGEILFRQGDEGDSLYVVVSGRLRVVSISADGTETLLAELGTGETVGEMAVISGGARSATVYATRDTQLAKLSKAAVDDVVERHPRSMLWMLTSRLVARMGTMSRGDQRRSAVATIAVVPAGGDVGLDEFAARFAAALARLGPAVHLTSAVVDARLGRPGVAQAHDRDGGSSGLLDWLAEQEADHHFVVYQADSRLSPWSERCVRQADRVVLAANARGDSAPGEVETELLGGDVRRRTPVTLALVHRDGTSAASGTARWLGDARFERHLHVRRDQRSDYDRLARFVTGNAVGLTLGGGFARGLAHLGVLRALHEVNIPIDALGGASMGSIVGAQWVLGWDAPRIMHEVCTCYAESFDDMTLPFLALKRGGKTSRYMRHLFQDTRIEDLWTPFFAVSANLNRSELKIHTTGQVADAVLASSRAPGIYPPMVIDGELHVDGGLINNVPVDVMKSFSNEGIVIGIDVAPPHELNQVANYGDDMPGWRAIWHRFNPARDKRIYRPSILLVLMRIIEFGGISYRRQKAEMADLYISPDVLRFRRNDFHAAEQLVQVGYDASRTALRAWLAAAPPGLRARRPDVFGART